MNSLSASFARTFAPFALKLTWTRDSTLYERANPHRRSRQTEDGRHFIKVDNCSPRSRFGASANGAGNSRSRESAPDAKRRSPGSGSARGNHGRQTPGIYLEGQVATNAQTGVEMEAFTAVSVAALTIYDMCKAIDKGITITDIRLESKTGGKSGDYQRKS